LEDNTLAHKLPDHHHHHHHDTHNPETTHAPISSRSAASKQLDSWLKSFHFESVSRSELAQYLHQKLNQALVQSEKLGRPNEFETAVCCHLLDIVTKTFGRYSQLVEQLKVEIYSAVYVDKDLLLASLEDGNASAAKFFQREPYFKRTQDLRTIKMDLEQDIEVATRQRDKLAAELLKKKKVLNATAFRWQRTLKKQAFGMWAKVVQMRKNQRLLLMQYFVNRDKSRLRLVVREWKLNTDESKRNKAKELLEESRERVTELEDTRKSLDEERKNTEQKMGELRRDLESARQELTELDAATLRVQHQLAESKEEELRTAAAAWAEIIDISATSQLAALRADLVGYNVDSFGDVGLLVDHPTITTTSGSRVTLKTLPPFPTEEEIEILRESRHAGAHEVLDFTKPNAALELPPDLIILRWVNFHLRAAGYNKVVENLSSDLQDSEELAVVLSACSKHCESSGTLPIKLRNVDVEARAQEIVGRAAKLGIPEHLLSVEDIVLGSSDMLYSVLAYLFCTSPMLQSDPSPWQVALGAIDRAIPAWRQMCADWGIVFQGEGEEDHHGGGSNNTSTPTTTNTSTPTTTLAATTEQAVPIPFEPNVAVKPASGALVDDVRVAKVAKQVLSACSAAKSAIARRNEAVQLWELVRERVRASAWHAMLQRSIGKPIELIDRKSVREFKSFTRLRGFKYGGGGGSDTSKGTMEGMPLWDRLSLEDHPRQQIAALTFVLESHFSDLKRIYRHYSCAEPGAAGTMDVNELRMLIKDTKLLDQTLTLNAIQHLFIATATANVGTSNTSTVSTNNGNTASNHLNRELMAPQFVEALVRLADAKFHEVATAWQDDNQVTNSGTDQKKTTEDNSEQGLLSLSQCLEKLLDEFIIPYACRSDADRFRRDLSRLEVKAVFRRHRDRLQQLFRHWCVSGGEVMDATQFRAFARDRNFISVAFTESELFSVFNKIQDEEGAMLASTGGLQLHVSGEGGNGHGTGSGGHKKSKKKKDNTEKTGKATTTPTTASGNKHGTVADQQDAIAMGHLNDEMTFSEFCEALAAIAVFKDPDPYLPLHQKLESFIFASVLGKLSSDD